MPFGANRIDYCGIGASSIKTYTETVESDHIQKLIFDAQQIIFLGMAYHDQNLQLLAKPGILQIKSIIGTAFGRSASDVKDISTQIAAWATDQSRNALLQSIQLYNNCPATQILNSRRHSRLLGLIWPAVRNLG